MPIYEYACADCGHHLEARQKFSDPALTDCPSCGGAALERLISESSFALKGGGWYQDGYGPGGKKADDKKADGKKADDKKDASGGGDGGAKKDDKPASSSGDKKSGGGDAKSKSSTSAA